MPLLVTTTAPEKPVFHWLGMLYVAEQPPPPPPKVVLKVTDPDALERGTVVLDGGLSTHLADAGYDLTDELWSARLLHDAPEAIVDAHLAFLRAGASVITTASYQGSVDGFARHGYDDPERLLRRSVRLAREAIDQMDHERPLWTATSVGPYGAVLADGSEYRGTTG